MGDFERRPESMRPVGAMFAESHRLDSLSRKIDGHIPVSCVIIVPQAIRITLLIRERKCWRKHISALFCDSAVGRCQARSTSEGDDGIRHKPQL